MRFALPASIALAALLAACSSTTPTSTSGSAVATAKPAGSQASKSHDEHGDHHDEHGEHHDEHGDMSGSLNAFHDVLAPLWHAAKGDSRTTSTCAAAADLHEGALAVDKGGPPANAKEPEQFRERSKKLIVTVDELGAECAKAGRPDFEAKFASVHDAFHGVMESSAPK